MLLEPEEWKHRKQFRWRLKGKSNSGTKVSFGDFGMKAVSSGYLDNRQIEAARQVLVRYVRNEWKIWLRTFPDMPYTKLALEMPMGKGKGEVASYRARVKKGKVVFEVNWIDKEIAQEAFRQASYKLPIDVKLIEKGEIL